MTTDPRVNAFGARLFWDRVLVAGQGCWLWDGARNPAGYGVLTGTVDGSSATIGAHRVAYEMLVGSIAKGLEVDHLCGVRECVRPDHFELVDHATNMARRGSRAVFGDLTPVPARIDVRVERMAAGLSQTELARRIGVSQGAVSQWERGKAQPSDVARRRMAAVLGAAA